MRKPLTIRKDSRPGYSRGNKFVGTREMINPKLHNCIICRHPEREEIERQYADGWRLNDITRAHPWIKSNSPLQDHFAAIGIKDELEKRREINSEEILERIVRAGLPVLEEGKVYPRDIIDAIKALNELKGKDRTESLWDLIMLRKKEHGSPDIVTASVG